MGENGGVENVIFLCAAKYVDLRNQNLSTKVSSLVSLTAFFIGLNFTSWSMTSGSSCPVSLYNNGFPLCIVDGSMIYLQCQFSSRSRTFTSLIEHWWPVFNLCSLTANWGWRHDVCSLIRVPSGLAVPLSSVGCNPAIGCHIPPHTWLLCLFCLSGAPAGTSGC